MIRTRDERQADRQWCEQFMDFDAIEEAGHGVVLGVAIGIGVWLIVAALVGWIA